MNLQRLLIFVGFGGTLLFLTSYIRSSLFSSISRDEGAFVSLLVLGLSLILSYVALTIVITAVNMLLNYLSRGSLTASANAGGICLPASGGDLAPAFAACREDSEQLRHILLAYAKSIDTRFKDRGSKEIELEIIEKFSPEICVTSADFDVMVKYILSKYDTNRIELKYFPEGKNLLFQGLRIGFVEEVIGRGGSPTSKGS